jgi:mono/diheme cytochrome c family protein
VLAPEILAHCSGCAEASALAWCVSLRPNKSYTAQHHIRRLPSPFLAEENVKTSKRGYGGFGFGVGLAVMSLAACADPSLSEGLQSASLVESDSASAKDTRACAPVAAGRRAFQEVLPGVENERACATCHVEAQAMTLSPAEVATRAPEDPLFNAIDADDPSASPLTFNNLRAGLVRVTLDLPENVDLLPIPPEASLFTPPAVSGQILALWQASIVPGSRLGDPMPPDRDLGNGVVIHFQPEIITPADRKISVWRAVPSVINTSYTAPYQADARAGSLEQQAFDALVAHGQLDESLFSMNDLKPQLSQLAAFQSSLFSDDLRAPYVAQQIQKLSRYVDEEAVPVAQDPRRDDARCHGEGVKRIRGVRKPCCDPARPSRTCLAKIGDPESVYRKALLAKLAPAQRDSWTRGKALYDGVCAGCHGSATDDRIMDRRLHDVFLALEPNGNLIYDAVVTSDGRTVYKPRLVSRPDSEFLNLGNSYLSHLGQLAGPARFPLANNQNGVKLPRYRLRFYERVSPGIATRSVRVVDLPPLPVVSGGAPFTPAADPNKPGALIVGPGFAPQLFSTDPGRALISGDFAEFEGFDVPQLRGVARTAPYFHDNSQTDLAMLVDTYSKFILPFFPQFDTVLAPVAPGTDRLTAEQEADLVTFLQAF